MSEKPMQYASGYVLDVYCRNSGKGVHTHDRVSAWTQFAGESFADCARQAKAAGWRLKRKDRTATCPYCILPATTQETRVYPEWDASIFYQGKEEVMFNGRVCMARHGVGHIPALSPTEDKP